MDCTLKEKRALAKNIVIRFTAKANLYCFNIHGLKHRGNERTFSEETVNCLKLIDITFGVQKLMAVLKKLNIKRKKIDLSGFLTEG